MKKQIGFLGGTFDPIHFGHINLAIQIKEKFDLEEVIFCPVNVSPSKVNNPPKSSGKDRLKLVELAIEDIPFFSVTDFEINKQGPSYTVDTLSHICRQRENENIILHFILSEDILLGLELWKDIEEIMKISSPLIGVGMGSSLNFFEKFSLQDMEITKKNLVEISKMDICSTDIRERLKKNLYCGHLLPPKVLDCIYKNQLYYSRISK
jgi:nicotinate-nucleotide adenylyltransferase